MQKHQDELTNLGITQDIRVSKNHLTASEGLVYGFLAEIIQRTELESFSSSRFNDLLDAISVDNIASIDLIVVKAYHYHTIGESNKLRAALDLISEIDYEDREDAENFYQFLAETPYRRLMILEAFCYKAYLEEKDKDEEEAYNTLNQLLGIIENNGVLGYQESQHISKFQLVIL